MDNIHILTHKFLLGNKPKIIHNLMVDIIVILIHKGYMGNTFSVIHTLLVDNITKIKSYSDNG